MLTTAFQRLMVAAVAVTLTGTARSAQATTITFDAVVTTPIPGGPDPFFGGLVLAYPIPVGAVPPIAFVTQGFDFGGLTDGVIVGPSFPNPSIADPAVCTTPLVCNDDHFSGDKQAAQFDNGSRSQRNGAPFVNGGKPTRRTN